MLFRKDNNKLKLTSTVILTINYKFDPIYTFFSTEFKGCTGLLLIHLWKSPDIVQAKIIEGDTS